MPCDCDSCKDRQEELELYEALLDESFYLAIRSVQYIADWQVAMIRKKS